MSLQGMSVERICKSLRQLAALKGIVQRHTLYIMCAVNILDNSAMEVTIVSLFFVRSSLFGKEILNYSLMFVLIFYHKCLNHKLFLWNN